VERRTGLVRQLTAGFTDYRRPERIEHTLSKLITQRVYGLPLGYEDLNDHDQLRHDPLIAVLAGKADPKGCNRRRKRGQGKATVGKCTLNRLELTPADADQRACYKKIVLHEQAIDQLLVNLFLQAHPCDR
jgi:hypothetical protein